MTMIPLCWPNDAGACACGRGHDGNRVGKAPLVRWEAFVSTAPTAQQGDAWRRRWPAANVGRLLEPDGLLVVDVDSDDALCEATALGLPRTPVVATAHGRHFYYTRPAGAPSTRTTRRGNSRGIDILAAGYIVAPPSRHREGARYRWILLPDHEPFAPAPTWAVELLRTATAAASAPPAVLPRELPPVVLDDLCVSFAVKRLIVEGGAARYRSRSEALFVVLQALIRAGYDDATIAGVVLAAPIGDKGRELGRRWFAGELARARAKCTVEIFA